MSSKAIVAAAGAGKTTYLVRCATELPTSANVLITTYTINNANEIKRMIREKVGRVPDNIHVLPWMTFLLREGARPYQLPLLGINRISGLCTDKETIAKRGRPKKAEEPLRYYCDRTNRLYSDYISDFVMECDRLADGAVFRRLASIYSHMYFDEIQDIAGRDFEVIECMLKASIRTLLVGDPRQATFSTANTNTNNKFKRSKIVHWLARLQHRGLIELDHKAISRRSNSLICKFADSVYPSLTFPDFPETKSEFDTQTEHDGPFVLHPDHVETYVERFAPQLLVWNCTVEDFGMDVRTMGEVKGLTYERVLIQPTGDMRKFLCGVDNLKPGTRAKLYVAITRARFSAAFVMTNTEKCTIPTWTP